MKNSKLVLNICLVKIFITIQLFNGLSAINLPQHPYLFANDNKIKEIKIRMSSNKEYEKEVKAMIMQGDELLNTPVIHANDNTTPHGKDNFLKAVSRTFKSRMEVLSFSYRITGNKKYVKRAWMDIATCAEMKDWGMPKMLAVSELAYGFGIAYDWMYDAFTPDQRKIMRSAICEKGFGAARLMYKGQNVPKVNDNFIKASNNFGAVVNGALGCAAIAIMKEDSDTGNELVKGALVPFNKWATDYINPDGVGNEGPMYWSYAMSYAVKFLSALSVFKEGDFIIANMSGFKKTITYAHHETGPTGLTFNYSDSNTKPLKSYCLYWLADKYNDPTIGWLAENVKNLKNEEENEDEEEISSLFDLLWAQPEKYSPLTEIQLSPTKVMHGKMELAFFRSEWNNPNAMYFALKGGDARLNHGHLDLGTFVLESQGVRWAIDQGIGSYNWPDYFNGDKSDKEGTRWTYYKTRAEGHNAFVINPDLLADQCFGRASFIASSEMKGNSFATLDMSEIYTKWAKSAYRGAKFDGKSVVLQDEVDMKVPSQYYWSMHTLASIKIGKGGKSAILKQNGKSLYVECLSPANAVFTDRAAEPFPGSVNPPQNQNGIKKGIHKFVISIPNTTNTTVVVRFSDKSDALNTIITPLSNWK